MTAGGAMISGARLTIGTWLLGGARFFSLLT